MRAFRSLDAVPPDFGPCALTVGNFDGVHIGHRRILDRVREAAAANGWRSAALTFDPHPAVVVAPDRAPHLMTTPEERLPLFEAAGIDQTLILPFTRGVAELSPHEFAERILRGALDVRAVLVGANFRFGHGQTGDVDVLAALGQRLGFTVDVVPAVRFRGRTVSSSATRALIAAGDVTMAARFLGRPVTLLGDVAPGRGVGSKQTVPTLNLATACKALPASGVYITRTLELGGTRQWRSVTNVGVRPTFSDSHALSIETFLLDPFEEPTPGRIAVRFLRRLRDEKRFPSPETLRAQILRDVERAQTWFRRTRAWITH